MLLTIPQAAELLACSTRQVRRLMDEGRIAYVRLGKTGRSDRIVEAELMRFIEDNQCHSTRSAASGTADFRSGEKSIDALLGPARAGKPRNLSDDTEERLRAVVELVAGHMSKH
jgi:excisionase family DNA binding protein